MASGRPRRPNDPSVLASLETAVSTVARPNIIGLTWQWRYELALVSALAAMVFGTGFAFGAVWLIAAASTSLILLTAAMSWPPSRKRLTAKAWCVITSHRVLTGCAQAWIQSRDGKLPIVLYTTQADFGERVMLWCRAGITAADLEAARDILSVACWAKDVRVVVSPRHRHVVVLEVIRREPGNRGPANRDDGELSPWPYLSRSEQS